MPLSSWSAECGLAFREGRAGDSVEILEQLSKACGFRPK